MPPNKPCSPQPEASQLLPAAAAKPGGDRALRQRILSWLQHHQQDSTKQLATAGPAAAAVAEPAGPANALSSAVTALRQGPVGTLRQGPVGLQQYDTPPLVLAPSDVTPAAWPSAEYGGPGAAAGPLNSLCEPSSNKALAVGTPGVSAKDKAARLWKKWKSALLPSKSTSRGHRASKKLSSALLQQHQQAQQQVTSAGLTIPDPSGHLGPTPHATHEPATPNTSSKTPLPGMPEAAATAAAAGMPGNVVSAFSSRLYELTHSGPATPASTPRPSTGAAAAGLEAEAAPDMSAAAASYSESPSSPHAGALAATWSGGTPSSLGQRHQVKRQHSTGSAACSSAHLAPHTPGAEKTAAACALKQQQPAVLLAGRQDTGFAPPASTSLSVRQLSGTALTAYPAVAAALTKTGVGLGMSMPAGWSSSAGNSRQAGPATPCSAAPPPAQASASAPAAAGGLSFDDEALSHWLLRAALLEDELQGRALEVREQLEGLGERRDMCEALLLTLHNSRSADGGGGGGEGLSGLRRTTPAGGSQVNATRHKLNQELSSINTASDHLAARAAALGSGIASLQGCQAVLCSSSKAAKLTAQSKLAVLQLVLGDLVSRLPDEALWELEVLQGLPAVDRAGEEMCRLAGAGSMAAAAAMGAGAAAAAAAVLGDVTASAASHSVNVDRGMCEASSSTLGSQLQQMGRSRAQTPTTPVAAAAASGAARCNLVRPLQTEQRMTASHSSGRYSPGHQVEGVNHRYGLGGSISSDGGSDAGEAGEGGSEDDGDDEEVIATIESVLSSVCYTPRPSLAYESRRASTAATAAPLVAQRGELQALLDIPPPAARQASSRGTTSTPWQQQQQKQPYREHMLAAATAKAMFLAGPATDPLQAAFAAGAVPSPSSPAAAAAAAPLAVQQAAAGQASPGSAGASWPAALQPVGTAPAGSQAQQCGAAAPCVDDDDHLDDWTTSPHSNSSSSTSCVTALSTIVEVMDEAAAADTSSAVAHQGTGSQPGQQLAAPHYTNGTAAGDSGLLAAAPARASLPAAADPSPVCAAAAEAAGSVSSSVPGRLASTQQGAALVPGPGCVARPSTAPSVLASQAGASGLQSVRLQQLLPPGDLNSMTVGQLLQALTLAVTQHQQHMQQEQQQQW